MNDKKHTPGPWEVRADPSHYDSFTTVVAGSGEQRKGMLRELIVEIGGWAGIETAEANARLIAAAPDMLEALKSLLAFVNSLGMEFGGVSKEKYLEAYEPLNKAHAAISKAEGGTP